MPLQRVLGARDAGWLVAGNMIGAGIFYTPGLVAGRLPGFAMPLTAWLLGGLLALCGALVYGELGARIPDAGGEYQYLTRTLGPAWGFLTGWAAFTLTFSAAVAAMALVVVDHLRTALPMLDRAPGWVLRGIPPVLVLLLVVANVHGARAAGRTTLWLTAIPVVGVIVLFAVGLTAGNAPPAIPRPTTGTPDLPPLAALGSAMVPIFFAYTGWNAAAYVAGEIRDPGRNLVRALVGGTLLVTVLYVALNAAFLVALPPDRLAGSTTAGPEAARRLLGPGAERLLAAAIAIALIGTANVTLMAGSRIYFAMASDGVAPRFLARVNPRGAPSSALWVSGVWTAVLALGTRVDRLVNWATLAILLLSALTMATLFALRRRNPSNAGFRCPGYPVVPLVYLVACLAVGWSSYVYAPGEARAGLAIVLAGLPLYALLRATGVLRPSP